MVRVGVDCELNTWRPREMLRNVSRSQDGKERKRRKRGANPNRSVTAVAEMALKRHVPNPLRKDDRATILVIYYSDIFPVPGNEVPICVSFPEG